MHGRRLALAAALTGAAVVVGGVAYASIPSSDGVITACYLKSGSALKVIDSAKSCPKGETMLTWSQAGTPGADGADGVSGYEVVSEDEMFEPNVTSVFAGKVVTCPAGKKALGGGLAFLDENGAETSSSASTVLDSHPKADGSGWQSAYYVSSTTFAKGVRGYVTCAAMAP